MSSEAVDFVSQLAGHRARDASPVLRGSAFFAWLRRWQRLLSVSCARAFACSLVRSRSEVPVSLADSAPDLADIFAVGF